MRIMWFCIPAHGHTNPTIEVVRELRARGHEIRYYSFAPFRERIEGAGAVFVPCDGYLPPLAGGAEKRLRRVSATEMSVQAFRTAARMDAMLAADVEAFRPTLIVSDSVCFWGKLTAQKFGLPMVCSTTTFAFNRCSSQYIKYSAAELADMILGLPRLKREMKKLRALGFRVKSPLDIVQNKNDTDTVVFCSEHFQPFAETFDRAHYRFVGPSVPQPRAVRREGERKRVYVSLGTVINDRPDFYRSCIEALRGEQVELLISCGGAFDASKLEAAENVRIENYVNQMEVLASTDLFITHCGMNSASEGLYMGVPELLFPLTGEQQAVARRVDELGAGRRLTREEAASPAALRRAVLAALGDPSLRAAAQELSADFRSAGGAAAAADFIEQVGG